MLKSLGRAVVQPFVVANRVREIHAEGCIQVFIRHFAVDGTFRVGEHELSVLRWSREVAVFLPYLQRLFLPLSGVKQYIVYDNLPLT